MTEVLSSRSFSLWMESRCTAPSRSGEARHCVPSMWRASTPQTFRPSWTLKVMSPPYLLHDPRKEQSRKCRASLAQLT